MNGVFSFLFCESIFVAVKTIPKRRVDKTIRIHCQLYSSTIRKTTFELLSPQWQRPHLFVVYEDSLERKQSFGVRIMK